MNLDCRVPVSCNFLFPTDLDDNHQILSLCGESEEEWGMGAGALYTTVWKQK